ncbi:type III PLP-dependent enzyme [Psychromicrobium sp. YIM B11713]|uniref:type III PLP-dependent enzyme n=1 Tax=Psychromicrobium sp. YIM B11713 TaxID=3145233 RepID=UPI00374E58E5
MTLQLSEPTTGLPLTDRVIEAARQLSAQHRLPAYLYDLEHLREHLRRIRNLFEQAGADVGILYATKANPDAEVVRTAASQVDGLEVSSGGEIAHVRSLLPEATLIFGGPGKTDAELATALAAGVHRYHVESLEELRRLDGLARQAGVLAEVLFRVNIDISGAVESSRSLDSEASPSVALGPAAGPALTMGGVPSPFGMDPEAAALAVAQLAESSNLSFRGVHAHLASGVEAVEAAAQAAEIARWARRFAVQHGVRVSELNVGGGMSVDYRNPERLFDWAEYAKLMAQVTAEFSEFRFEIEPGRALSAYSGWYASSVLELKRSHGEWFGICAGGTHHLRTPAAKGHSQPFAVLPIEEWQRPWARTELRQQRVSLVGQLCTPKDLLAKQAPVAELRTGDVVLFALAGAYALNISHRDFLMHPAPQIVHLGGIAAD